MCLFNEDELMPSHVQVKKFKGGMAGFKDMGGVTDKAD